MTIPYGRQHIDDDDIAAVVAVLKGERLTQGPHIEEFEQRLVDVTGARFAVAFANGTAALHAAVVAAGLGTGDRVVTSALSFAASANCARYAGAAVDFVDIDPGTWNLDPAQVPAADGLVAVHFAGLPVDLTRLARRPRVVIEDGAHALGARTPDGPVGNCAHSDLCCFSFHPVKTITTGEGGAVTTNSPALAARLRRFRHHGITARPDEAAWAYDIDELGYNYRLTDIQAALGTSQLGKLDRFLARRAELAAAYRDRLAGVDGLVLPPAAPPGFTHAHHLFAVRVRHRAAVHAALAAAGIATQVHYKPIYRLTAYAGDGSAPQRFPHTEAVTAGILSLPLFPDLTADEQDRVVAALRAGPGAT